MHYGMIATGNHIDFDSLRAAPRPYRGMRIRLGLVITVNAYRRDAGDGCPYERNGAVGNGLIRSAIPGASRGMHEDAPQKPDDKKQHRLAPFPGSADVFCSCMAISKPYFAKRGAIFWR